MSPFLSSSSYPNLKLPSLNKGIIIDRQEDLIGRGNYGLVFKATFVDPSTNALTPVVAKRALSATYDGVSWEREQRCQFYLANEERVNRHVANTFKNRKYSSSQHSSVVSFLGADTMPDDNQKYLFFKFVEGPGTLQDVSSLSALRSILHPPSPSDPPITRSGLNSFLDELLSLLLSSLIPLHDVGVVHRDVKPDNILVDPSTSSLLLIDFGSARDLFSSALPPPFSPPSLRSRVSSSVSSLLCRLPSSLRPRGVLFPEAEDLVAVTPTFSAPELHAINPTANPSSFDVFSIALVFLSYVFSCSHDSLLLASHRHHLERNAFDLRSWHSSLRRQTVLPGGAMRASAYLDRHGGAPWDLLQALLSPNPEERPSARDARDVVEGWRDRERAAGGSAVAATAKREGRRKELKVEMQVGRPENRDAATYGTSSVSGFGLLNEDAVLLKTYPPPTYSSFPSNLSVVGGVFDGHAGPQAASFLRTNFVGLFERRLADAGALGENCYDDECLRAALYGAWDDAVISYRAITASAAAAGGDDNLSVVSNADSDNDRMEDVADVKEGVGNVSVHQAKSASITSRSMSSGTTACIAVLVNYNHVRGASESEKVKPVGALLNCGDSRGIVFRKDQLLLSTVDHVPAISSNESVNGWERRHLVRFRDGSDWLYDVTRSLEAEDVERAGISSQPDIFLLPSSLVEKGDVVLLATDGLWDYVSNSDAMSIVNSAFANGATACAAAEAVTTSARERGAKGENVSVVVITV